MSISRTDVSFIRENAHLQTERHDNHSMTGRRIGLVQAAQKVSTGASTATKCTKTHRLRIGCNVQSVASDTTRNVAVTNLYVTSNRVGDCTLYLTIYAIIAFKWYNFIRNYNRRGVQSSSGVGDCRPCLTFAFIAVK